MLTDTQIRNLKPAEKAKKYADGGGLYLYVAKTGSSCSVSGNIRLSP